MKQENNNVAIETIESVKNQLHPSTSLNKQDYYPLTFLKNENEKHSSQEKIEQETDKTVVDSEPNTAKNKTVFCIDDSKTTQFMVDKFLSEAGYKVIGNTEPLKCLMLLVEKKPDIIIMDIKMPGIGGYDLLKIIKSSAKLKNIPVIMLTSQTREFDRIRAKLLGAEGYVTKPFSAESLVTVVDRVSEAVKISS